MPKLIIAKLVLVETGSWEWEKEVFTVSYYNSVGKIMSKCQDKKYPCDDCFSCQFCSDERCAVCLCSKNKPRQLSVEEQIALYEALNKEAFGKE